MRCFLAAWPSEEARRRCAELIDSVRPYADHGRVMRAENLHLTVAFIGELDDRAGGDIAAACRGLHLPPCEWHLDAIGYFARPRVLWAGGPMSPLLAQIVQAARALLDQASVEYDHKEFVPHVTLLRDVRRYDGSRDVRPPIAWPIEEIALYRTGRDASGARYARVEPA